MENELTPSWFVGIDWTGARRDGGARAGSIALRMPVGRGGMGEVWRGVHPGIAQPIAVKFLIHDIARDPAFQSAFRQEVRAAAQLSHPGIIRILDLGVLDETAELATGGRMVAGSPYVGMELIKGGTLQAAVRKPRPWPELHHVLGALLDALSHAHARGVIHRDLKPTNVLLRDKSDVRAGIVLTDFGLARFEEDLRSSGVDEAMLGTRDYMAPEQLLGRFRDLGPWTDLYAFGCLAWELVTGAAPFSNRPADEPASARVFARPAAFAPRVEVPPELESLLRRLLAPPLRERPASPAEAWEVLAGLGPERTIHSLPDEPRGEGLTLEPTVTTPLAPRVGLGVFGLAATRFHGRRAERSRLQQQFERACNGHGPCIVALHGAPGTGKSRLGAWLLHRARELGIAETLQGRDGEQGSLSAPVFRHARAVGLPPAKAMARLNEALGQTSATGRSEPTTFIKVLAEHVHPAARAEEVDSADLLVRYVLGLSRHKPVIVFVDDVASEEALRMAELLSRHGKGSAVMLVVAVADETEPGALVDAVPIELPALDLPEHRAFCDAQLRASSDLVEHLFAAGLGIPRATLDLISGWADAGRVVVEDGAFVDRGETSVPDDAAEMRAGRLTRVLDDCTDEERRALGLAGLIGTELPADVWKDSCARIDAALGPQVADRLVMEGIVSANAGGWVFINASAPSLLAAKIDDEQISVFHSAIAEAFARSQHRFVDERIARHRGAAGEPTAAIEAYLKAAEQRLRALAPDRALALLEERQHLIESHGVSARKRVEGTLVRAACLHARGELDSADSIALAARSESAEAGLPDLEARAMHQRARGARARGDLRSALSLLESAAELAAGSGLIELVGDCRVDQAAISKSQGRLDDADRFASAAIGAYEAAAARGGVGIAQLIAAQIDKRAGRFDGARTHALAALECFEVAGLRRPVPEVLNELGELARSLGDPATAEHHYRCALEQLVTLGSPAAATAELNLALLLLSVNRDDEARVCFAGALGSLRAQGRHTEADRAQLIELPDCAEDGDWVRWDEITTTAFEAMSRMAALDTDLVMLLRRGADVAHRFGKDERARRLRAHIPNGTETAPM